MLCSLFFSLFFFLFVIYCCSLRFTNPFSVMFNFLLILSSVTFYLKHVLKSDLSLFFFLSVYLTCSVFHLAFWIYRIVIISVLRSLLITVAFLGQFHSIFLSGVGFFCCFACLAIFDWMQTFWILHFWVLDIPLNILELCFEMLLIGNGLILLGLAFKLYQAKTKQYLM